VNGAIANLPSKSGYPPRDAGSRLGTALDLLAPFTGGGAHLPAN
jgi:hypothetical protein